MNCKVAHPECYGIVVILEENNTFSKQAAWTLLKTSVDTEPDME